MLMMMLREGAPFVAVSLVLTPGIALVVIALGLARLSGWRIPAVLAVAGVSVLAWLSALAAWWGMTLVGDAQQFAPPEQVQTLMAAGVSMAMHGTTATGICLAIAAMIGAWAAAVGVVARRGPDTSWSLGPPVAVAVGTVALAVAVIGFSPSVDFGSLGLSATVMLGGLAVAVACARTPSAATDLAANAEGRLAVGLLAALATAGMASAGTGMARTAVFGAVARAAPEQKNDLLLTALDTMSWTPEVLAFAGLIVLAVVGSAPVVRHSLTARSIVGAAAACLVAATAVASIGWSHHAVDSWFRYMTTDESLVDDLRKRGIELPTVADGDPVEWSSYTLDVNRDSVRWNGWRLEPLTDGGFYPGQLDDGVLTELADDLVEDMAMAEELSGRADEAVVVTVRADAAVPWSTMRPILWTVHAGGVSSVRVAALAQSTLVVRSADIHEAPSPLDGTTPWQTVVDQISHTPLPVGPPSPPGAVDPNEAQDPL